MNPVLWCRPSSGAAFSSNRRSGISPNQGSRARNPGASGPKREPSRASILVVDDDDDIRESLARVLEDAGYHVYSAANGREALDVLDEVELPALAIVDLRMPIMDGVQLIEAMRRDARYAALPVIVVSAASTMVPPAGLLVLRKPFSIHHLLSAVRANTGAGTN